MKRAAGALLGAALGLFVACSAPQKQAEAQVLTWSQTLCLMQNPGLEPPAVAVLCTIDLALVPLVEQFLLTYRGQLNDEHTRAEKAALARATCPPAASSAPVAPPSASAPVPVPPTSAAPVAPPPSASAPTKPKRKP